MVKRLNHSPLWFREEFTTDNMFLWRLENDLKKGCLLQWSIGLQNRLDSPPHLGPGPRTLPTAIVVVFNDSSPGSIISLCIDHSYIFRYRSWYCLHILWYIYIYSWVYSEFLVTTWSLGIGSTQLVQPFLLTLRAGDLEVGLLHGPRNHRWT